jgi:hypothetical protein
MAGALGRMLLGAQGPACSMTNAPPGSRGGRGPRGWRLAALAAVVFSFWVYAAPYRVFNFSFSRL